MHALLTMDVTEVADRDGALDLVLSKQEQLAEPDFVRMCQAMIKLDRPEAVAKLLKRLAENEVSRIDYLSYEFTTFYRAVTNSSPINWLLISSTLPRSSSRAHVCGI